MTRRYSDPELYEAARKHGDQTAAAAELGISTSWLAKRTRAYAKANGLAIPRGSGHPLPVVRVRVPDTFSHRRLRDGGTRVSAQRRARMTAQGGPAGRLPLRVAPLSADRVGLDTATARAVSGESTQARQNRSWPPA